MCLDPKVFPELNSLVGHTLMVTDGTSLLGADDKAVLWKLWKLFVIYNNIQKLNMVPFALDLHQTKEIGRGPHKFDVDRFNADFAYTMDGSQYGELQYESFNAAEAIITCHGVNVHPGSAKNAMVNAIRLGEQFDSLSLPDSEVPERR